MAAVQSITFSNINKQRQAFETKKNKKNNNNIVVLNAADTNLLSNFLEVTGKHNRALVSFGKKLEVLNYNNQRPIQYTSVIPAGKNFPVDAFRNGISSYAEWKIKTAATDRIYGRHPWPKIDHINAWMVSAETHKFMFVGGLAQVAADLPNSFNKRFKNGDDKMINITPMYKDENRNIITDGNGNLYYQYFKRKVKNPVTGVVEDKTKCIKISPVGSINVPIYRPSTNTKMEDTRVDIYRAYTDYTLDENGKPNNDGTYYYFLDTPDTRADENNNIVSNAQIFNVEENEPKTSNSGTPYANNKYGTDEVFRMAFFSKAVYEMMKAAKEGKLKDIEAPNAVLLNDWHAGPLAAMINYTANAEADTGRMSKEAGKYFDELPIIYIAHNVEHQGSTNSDDNKRTSIFATLFGGYSVDILKNAHNWQPGDSRFNPQEADACALMKGNDFSSAMTGMSLSDRVVPVSEHYAYELTESNVKSNGLMDLMKARYYGEGHTLTPITNGYSKAKIFPTKSHMEQIVKATKEDFLLNGAESIDFSNFNLRPYDDCNLENKIYNKNQIMDIFKQTILRERYLMNKGDYGSRNYLLHDPFNTDISSIKDFSNTPVIAFVGRVDSQKGLDSIFKDAMWKFVEHNLYTPKDRLPVFILGGKISNMKAYEALAYGLKDELIKKSNEEPDPIKKQGYRNIAERIILINGFVRTDLVAAAADMFLVPSKFEPCGLTQLEAMAKGALPIATSTGGLVNTIKDNVDGFRTKEFYDIEDGWRTTTKLYGDKSHNEFSSNGEAYCEAIERALNVYYNDHKKFEQMQKTAMQNDFSWDMPGGALDKYINLIKTGRTV